MDKRINIDTELLPCPFCGADMSDGGKTRDAECYFMLHRALINAPKGDLTGVPGVLESWNRRTTPPATGETEDLPALEKSIDTPEFLDLVCSWRDGIADGALWSDIIDHIEDYAREAIAHYQRKQAGQDESGDGSNVLRPFAAPASQHDAGFAEIKPWKERLFEEQPSLKGQYRNDESGALDEMGIYHAHDEIDDLRAELARRCRVQGGNTNTPLAYIPPHIMESLRNGCRVGTVLEPKPENGCTEALYGR